MRTQVGITFGININLKEIWCKMKMDREILIIRSFSMKKINTPKTANSR